MNIPVKITISRIIFTFFIMALLFVSGPLSKIACLLLFFLAAATDWMDGYLARRLKQITPLGILLDPIADKVLVIGILLAFVQLELVKAWMVLVIIIRELVITGVRLYALSRKTVIPAAQEGKHKTFSQMFTIAAVLMLLCAKEFIPVSDIENFDAWMVKIAMWMMWVTVFLTLVSGISFFWRNRSVLANAKDS